MSTQETGVIRMADLSPEYAEIMVLGKVLAMSGYFADVRDQAQAVTKILYGRELGFSPIISMGGIHVIEGKPSLSSNLMATLIKRSGKYDYRVRKWDNTECVLYFREKINNQWEEVGPASFSIEDAKTAGIKFKSDKGYPTSWSKYPKAMLFARALSQGLRTYCPDVSAAPIYNPEELGAEVDEEGAVTKLPNPPVERTTEPIPIKPSPLKSEPESTDGRRHVTGTLVSGSGPREAEGRGGALPPSSAPTPAPVSLPGKPEYITPKQASNIHSRFQSTLHPDLKPKGDRLLDEWLASNGYKKPTGEPSTSMILAGEYQTVGKKIVEHAKTLTAVVTETVPQTQTEDEFLGI